MSLQQNHSTVPSKTALPNKRNTNWHEAAVCAVQIDLQEYTHLLQFLSEYILGRNHYRIDLLIIKKINQKIIPKNIASIFKTYNLFEIKGIGSCGKRAKIIVEKFSSGIYHVINEIFIIQFIVTKELPPEENLYLHCLTDNLNNTELIKQLVDDYQKHQEQDIYIRYMNQLTNANSNTKGRLPMLFEEMMERARAEAKDYYQDYYQNKIEQLSSSNKQLSSSVEQLVSQVDYLKNLLKQHNIQFD